jgi:hypothetical protein
MHRRSRAAWTDLTWPDRHVRETRNNATEWHGSWDSSCVRADGRCRWALALPVPRPTPRVAFSHDGVPSVARCRLQCMHGLWVWEFPGVYITCSRSWFLGRRHQELEIEFHSNCTAEFQAVPTQKTFYPYHQIFGHIHKTLNIEKKLITQFGCKLKDKCLSLINPYLAIIATVTYMC